MDISYDRKGVSIEKLPISGIRIDQVHGKAYIVSPRFYSVKDLNLRVSGDWLVELHSKQVQRADGFVYEATVIRIFLAPKRASKRMASLTRQSIMVQPATRGTYLGRPYAHVTFREPGRFGGKRTARRGQKEFLPKWFSKHYGRRIRLRETVQGKVASAAPISGVHNTKQVIVFDRWDDVEFVRLYFMMRVFSADQGFVFDEKTRLA